MIKSKIKFALAAFLGFAAACSGVKNTPSKGLDDPAQTADSLAAADTTGTMRHVVVMYGVRIPDPKIAVAPNVVRSAQSADSVQTKKEARKAHRAEERRLRAADRATLDSYDPANTEQEEPDYD